MNSLKVAVAVNENYVYPLKVMLHSLFSTQEVKTTVFVVHTRLGEECVKELKDFCAAYDEEMVEIRIEDDSFEQALVMNPAMKYVSRETYYRLILPWLLPEEKRVLYLDADIIVNGSLTHLWNMEMGGVLMAAAEDRCVMLLGTKAREYMSKDAVYKNAGVALMNLERMREKTSWEAICSLLEKRGEELAFMDQDIMNILWEDEIKQIEGVYNVDPNLLYLKEYLSLPLRVCQEKCVNFLYF